MIGDAAGCTLGGFLTDALLRRTGSRRWSRRIMGLTGKGLGAVLLLTGASVNEPLAAVVLITLSAFCADLAVASHWAVCSDTAGRYVATVFGAMNMIAGLGAVLSPVLAGQVLEWLSPTAVGDALARERAWDVVMLVFAGTLGACALCWLRIDAEEPMVRE
jgi:MFS family permease